MSLSLEPFVFLELERHFQMQEYLGPHSWGLNMDDGCVVFAIDGTNDTVRCPVQILGTLSYQTETWLWGWNNRQSDIPAKLLKCGPMIQKAARAEDTQFIATKSFRINRENHAQELAIIAAGFCELFTFYSCDVEQSALFVGIESMREIANQERTAVLAESVLTTGISMFDFKHQPAVRAYLGTPKKTVKSTSEYTIEGKPFCIRFDSMGRISSIDH